jgi:hypothetical protein
MTVRGAVLLWAAGFWWSAAWAIGQEGPAANEPAPTRSALVAQPAPDAPAEAAEPTPEPPVEPADVAPEPPAELPAAPAAGAPIDFTPPVRPAWSLIDENKLYLILQHAVQSDADLVGAWVFVDDRQAADDRGRYLFRAILDSDDRRAVTQGAALERLIRQWVPEGGFEIVPLADGRGRPVRLPVARLTAELQARCESDVRLHGCRLRDAYLTQPAAAQRDQLALVLRGTIGIAPAAAAAAGEFPTQQRVLFALALGEMRRDPAWSSEAVLGEKVPAVPLAVDVDADQRMDATHPLPTIDLGQLQARMEREVRTNAKLHGSWLWIGLDVEALPVTKFTVVRVLDRRRQAQQRAELDRFLEDWIPAGNPFDPPRDEQDEVYPVSDLVEALQDRVESHPELKDCLITGAWLHRRPPAPGEQPRAFDPATEELELVLRGRIGDDRRQPATIAREADRLLTASPAWVKAGAPGGLAVVPNVNFTDDVGVPELRTVAPNESRGRALYEQGLRHYRSLRFEEAAESFRMASIESPRKLAYRYWNILARLANNERDAAAERMTHVVRIYGVDPASPSPEYRRAIRSLERVQGPLRNDLFAIESAAVFQNAAGR